MDKETWDSDGTVSMFMLLNHCTIHIDQLMILYQSEQKVFHDECLPCGETLSGR